MKWNMWICCLYKNKLASLEATLGWPTLLVNWWLTGVRCRATRVAKNLFFFLCRTQCQDELRSLSGSVPEILTACRMHKILIAWCQIEAEIRGFPTMYINGGGVNIVKIGEKRDFVQISGLKTPISSDRNFKHLTSERSVAWNLEILSSLTPSLQNMDIDGSN